MHEDLAPRNILVQDGRITVLLDWGSAGWYPEHMEYCFTKNWGAGLIGLATSELKKRKQTEKCCSGFGVRVMSWMIPMTPVMVRGTVGY